MRPRPQPRQLQLPQPRPRSSPPARHFPLPPLLSLPGLCSSFQASLSLSPLFFPFPSFRFPPLPSSPPFLAPFTPPPASPRSVCPLRLHLPVPFSAPLPRPSLLLALPSPTVPRLAKGQISRGNLQRQTRSSDFIIVVNLPLQFLPHGSEPARLELRTEAEAEPAACLFRLKPLPQPLGLPPPRGLHFSAGGHAPGFSLPFPSPRSLSLPPSFFI